MALSQAILDKVSAVYTPERMYQDAGLQSFTDDEDRLQWGRLNDDGALKRVGRSSLENLQDQDPLRYYGDRLRQSGRLMLGGGYAPGEGSALDQPYTHKYHPLNPAEDFSTYKSFLDKYVGEGTEGTVETDEFGIPIYTSATGNIGAFPYRGEKGGLIHDKDFMKWAGLMGAVVGGGALLNGAGLIGATAPAAELGAWGAASSGEMAAALAADATAYGTGAGAFGFDAASYAANAGAGLGAIEGAGGAFDAAGLEIGGDSIGNAARYGASYQPTWMDQLRQFWNGTPPGTSQIVSQAMPQQDRGWGPLIQGGMSVASGIYGLTQAEQQKKRALAMAAGSDPWGTSGGRADAARRLMELNRDPTGAMASDPRYAAMVQAAQRTMGRKGQDSGAMAVAGAEAGGNWLTQRMNELGMQAGIGFSPTNAASLGIQGSQNALNLAGQNLASIGYGVNTAMGGTNSSQQMLAQLAALIKQNRVS